MAEAAAEITHDDVRDMLRRVAADKGEWCGIPMPIEDARLVIEPSYPRAVELMNFYPDGVVRLDDDEPRWTRRSSFWSSRHRCGVEIYECDGRVRHYLDATKKVTCELKTMGASVVWGIEQELRAMGTLRALIASHAFEKYFLTGMFLESSKRSGVTYMFRKLRPTVALTPHKRLDEMTILAALCMHPIGYYAGSWAGAMCPTDDVIAHLMLMRGDEHMFWKRCAQHRPEMPQAGI